MIDSLYSQALAHHQAGALQQADALYRQILSINPDHVPTLIMLGVLAHQVGRSDAAVQLLTRAAQVDPQNADAHNNLGVALAVTGQLPLAIASYQAALQIRPHDARANNNLGTAFRDAGRLPDAVAAYSRAIAIASDYSEAHDNLGLAYQQLGDLPKAIAHFRHATTISPDIVDFHAHLAFALRESGKLDESIAAARQAVSLDANNVAALSTLASSLKDVGQLDDALDGFRKAAALPGGGGAADSYFFAIHLHPAYTPQRIVDEHRKWAQRFPIPSRVYPNDKFPTRPLRIGYVSPDFRHHVVAYNVIPLFENHDRSQFQVFAYSNTPRHDDLTARFRSLANWRDINGLSDEHAASVVASDWIDILVDLALHTTGNRLGVLAVKPAPVQVSFAGYPSTTGLSTIDYRLTDPHLDPPGGHDDFYTEQSVRLPYSFWCYRPHDDVPVNPLPALAAGHVTFGYLGAFSKINAPTLDLWSSVLAAVPNSKMILMARPGSPRTRTLEYFAGRGIAPARIEFVDYRPRRPYLETYHRVDIVLDSYPYNGHTTNLDALYMGVPVVTLYGQTAVSRAGLSQLTNLGLGPLATDDPARFMQIATGLASDLNTLSSLRATLRERMQGSPLTDAKAYTRAIESAYRGMWQRFCASQ